MKYEITIRELTPFTEEEKKERNSFNNNHSSLGYPPVYSDEPFHEVRVLQAEVSKEEFEAVKKAIIGTM